MNAPLNVYVDDGAGRTYRVCFVTGNPRSVGGVFAVRIGHDRRDVGPALAGWGRKARQLVAKARATLTSNPEN